MKLHVLSLAPLVCFLLAHQTLAQEVAPASAEVPVHASPHDAEVERVRRIVGGLRAEASTPARLIQLTRDLQPEVASRAYLLVADDFLAEGQADLAAEVFEHLLEHFAKQPAAEEASLQLVRLYSSGELAHTQRSEEQTNGGLPLPPGWKRTQSVDSPAAGQRTTPNHNLLTYASYLANRQLQQQPQLAKNSVFAFQCAAAARQGNRPAEANSWLTLVKHKRGFPQWRRRARAEAWLQEGREGEPPIPAIRCTTAAQPPRLDGILNETLWESAGRLVPELPVAKSDAELLISYDAGHLYLAARCQKLENQIYRRDTRPRTYDADLSDHDRLRVTLDIDRDYTTGYELAIDDRGWTSDTCWRDKSWNPKWFVASGGTDFWTFEAAIPWDQLTPHPPQTGHAWAIAAERLIPSEKEAFDQTNAKAKFRLLLFE